MTKRTTSSSSSVILSEGDNKTSEMYKEIIKTFKKTVQAEIKELEQIPELMNLNKWVQKNNPTVVDAEDPVMKIQMALSGRSIRNLSSDWPCLVLVRLLTYRLRSADYSW